MFHRCQGPYSNLLMGACAIGVPAAVYMVGRTPCTPLSQQGNLHMSVRIPAVGSKGGIGWLAEGLRSSAWICSSPVLWQCCGGSRPVSERSGAAEQPCPAVRRAAIWRAVWSAAAATRTQSMLPNVVRQPLSEQAQIEVRENTDVAFQYVRVSAT